MKVLFDHNVNRHFKQHLTNHDVKTTREMGWDRLANGELLRASAGAGFEAFLSIDKNIQHQQNLDDLPIPIIVLDSISNALPALVPFAPHVQRLLSTELAKALYLIAPDGTVFRYPLPLK